MGFFLGTRSALFDGGRESLTLTIKEVSPFSVGLLIALFERAVGLYASLVNINAYHQPGVEAGKKAASEILALEAKILKHLTNSTSQAATVVQIARAIGASEEVEAVFKICEHLAANSERGIVKQPGHSSFDAVYQKS